MKDATRRQHQTLAGVTLALIVSILLGLIAFAQRKADVVSATPAPTQAASTDIPRNTEVTAQPTAITNKGEIAILSVSVRDLAFSPDGKILASVSKKGAILLQDVATGQIVGQLLDENDADVSNIAISPDGALLAAGYCPGFNAQGACVRGVIILWSLRTLQPIGQPLRGYTNWVNIVAFSPDGSILASGGENGVVILWDVASREPIRQVTREPSTVLSLAFSPDGKLLAIPDRNGAIRLWNGVTGESVGRPLIGHSDWVYSLAFSPDGSILASESADDTIILWDTTTWKPIKQLPIGQLGYVPRVVFSADGKTLAAGGSTGVILLWDMATGQAIGLPMRADLDSVNSLAFSPVSNILASGGTDGTILWNVDPESWVGRSCQRLGRNLTREEWDRYFPGEEYRKTCEQWPLEAEPTLTPTATP